MSNLHPLEVVDRGSETHFKWELLGLYRDPINTKHVYNHDNIYTMLENVFDVGPTLYKFY